MKCPLEKQWLLPGHLINLVTESEHTSLTQRNLKCRNDCISFPLFFFMSNQFFFKAFCCLVFFYVTETGHFDSGASQWEDPCIWVTHWGWTVADCETPLSGDLWVCRPPEPLVIPAPGSVGWMSSPVPSPLAWRSGSRAGWAPMERASDQGRGLWHKIRDSDKGWGCAWIPGMSSTFDMLEHICHALQVFF